MVVSDSVIPEPRQSHRPQLVVNINTADAVALAKHLHGIGPKKAAAIVDFREKNGPFQSIYDLARVKGIGKKTIERNRDKIVLSDPEVETDQAYAPPSTTDDASSGTDETAPETASTSPTTDQTEQTPTTDDQANTPDATKSQ
jgi:competence protein ComEA